MKNNLSQWQFRKKFEWYQRGNQNPWIDEEQTTQYPKEKGQKDKQRSTKHTYKTKDRVTRIPLKTVGELRCWGRVSFPSSTSGTRRVKLFGSNGFCLNIIWKFQLPLEIKQTEYILVDLEKSTKFSKITRDKVRPHLILGTYMINFSWNVIIE